MLAAFPFVQGSQVQLLAAVLVLGVFSGAAAGVSYALATRQGDGGAATVGVALGYVSSAPVVLAIEAGWRIGPACPWRKLLLLYSCTAAITCAALAAAASIIRRQQQEELAAALGMEQPLLDEAGRGRQAWLVEGSTASAMPAAAAGTSSQPAGHDALAAAELEDASSASRLPARAQPALLRSLWPAALSLGLSVGTSMLLFPLFTRFRSTGALGDMMLPVALFWVRAFADIAGRLLPKLCCAPPPAPRTLLTLAVARLLLLPLPMLRIAGLLPTALQSDGLLMAYVALQWLGSGAVNAWAFLLVPRMVASELAVQAAGVMTLVFNCACLGGLLLAVPLQLVL